MNVFNNMRGERIFEKKKKNEKAPLHKERNLMMMES